MAQIRPRRRTLERAAEYLFKGLREVIFVAENVRRLTVNVERIENEVRDHDRRLVRLETMVEVARDLGTRRLKDD